MATTAPPDSVLARLAPPPLLAGPLAMLCWAGSIVVVRDAAGVVPPAGLSFWRCLLALALLYPLCRPALRAQWPLMRAHWRIICALGALLFIGGNGMLFVGLQFTTAINAALVNAAEPVAIVACAWAMFRDRLTPAQWLGVLLSLAGVVHLVARGDLPALLTLRLNAGDMFVLVSVVSWAFYAVLLRRAPPGLDRLCLLFGILAAGAASVLPFWVVEAVLLGPPPLVWRTAWAVGFNAVFASILGMFWWNHAVERLGPGRAGLFVHLIPVFTVLLAIAFLGEDLLRFHAVGIGLVAAGIYLTTASRSRPRRRRL